MNRPIMELDRAETDAGGKAHDCIAVNAGEPLSPNATAFGESGYDVNLLVLRKNVHDGPNPL
jgi:hypothetical protein